MKFKIISAAVLAAGFMFAMGSATQPAEAGVNITIGVPGVYIGTGHRHTHCHRHRVWRNGHRVWVRRCHRHSHGHGHH